MRVSVVIPTYNRASTINRALESVFAQTIQDFEVIIVDDGSTDDTEGVVRERWGDAVRFHRQENQGACVARNTGIDLASGDYLTFLDSDDEWVPEKLEKQLAVFGTEDDPSLGLVLCAYRSVRADSERNDLDRFAIQGEAFEALTDGRLVMGSNIGFMAHRRVIDAGVRFDPGQVALQDREFITAAATKFTMRTVVEPLLIAYKDDGGVHVNTLSRVIPARVRILDKYRDLLARRPKSLAKNHRTIAKLYYWLGDLDAMRRHLRTAQELHPRRINGFWMMLSHANRKSFGAATRGNTLIGGMLSRMRIAAPTGPFE